MQGGLPFRPLRGCGTPTPTAAHAAAPWPCPLPPCVQGMMEDLRAAPEGAIVILHACAHNPTGARSFPWVHRTRAGLGDCAASCVAGCGACRRRSLSQD